MPAMTTGTIRGLAVAAAIFTCAGTARGADGVLITQKMTANGSTGTAQVQIEKTRARAESAGLNGGRQIVIFDGAAQVMRLLDMDKKTYTEVTKADVDRMADQMTG